MQDRRGVLELARLADDRRLAVALDRRRGHAERRDGLLAEHAAELLADLHQLLEIVGVAARERIGDHRKRHRLAVGAFNSRPISRSVVSTTTRYLRTLACMVPCGLAPSFRSARV